MTLLLAQSQVLSRTGDLMWALVLTAGGAALLGTIGMVVYRMLSRIHRDEGAGAAFTLSALRRMHEAGQLTDEEFARVKAALLTRSKEPDQVSESNRDEPPSQ